MKRIGKRQEPPALECWRVANAGIPENLDYGRGGMPTVEIRRSLLGEQGYICAYTMLSTPTDNECHIEHVVPQGQCRSMAIDYNNMVACHPGTRNALGRGSKCPFGAHAKGGTHINPENFISPLQEDVELRFRYDSMGSVHPANHGDSIAESTIAILKLNHPELVELRKAAIDEMILDNKLSAEEARRLSQAMLERDQREAFAQFCFALSQVAQQYSEQLGACVQ